MKGILGTGWKLAKMDVGKTEYSQWSVFLYASCISWQMSNHQLVLSLQTEKKCLVEIFLMPCQKKHFYDVKVVTFFFGGGYFILFGYNFNPLLLIHC